MGTTKTLKELVNQVPQEPGVYLWKDKHGEVLYVGKAKNLRARMRQYVNGDDEREKIPLMMEEVTSFDYIVVNSEHEALVLELNLIQQYRPPYNVDFVDDKSYPFIAITESDMYPCIKYTREKHVKGTRYFGPYTDARSARAAIDIVRKVCPVCIGTCAEWKKVKRLASAHPELCQDGAAPLTEKLAAEGRPCFDAHVGRGPGVCYGAVTQEEYAETIQTVEDLISGHRNKLEEELQREITAAAAELNFEKAERYKRRLLAIQNLEDSQKVYFASALDADFIGIYREETIAAACIFVVREGRLIRSVDFMLNKGMDIPESELTSAFIKTYYARTQDVPKQIEVACIPEDIEPLQFWLAQKTQHDKYPHKVKILKPQRGERKALMDMATRNARHALVRYELRTGYDDERKNLALRELESALSLESAPMRIECFDISTIHGAHTVASMVVFSDGGPDKSQYRRFKIRTPLDEANDFLSMSEVFDRRYSPERMGDKRFGKRPDLIIVDGGKPQLTAALKQLESLGLSIPVVGLAKADEELFVPWQDDPVVLPSGSASLYLVKRVRDEAHRFAITFHRELRNKAMTISILDEIEGVGPKRKKALLKHFGSFKKVKSATLEQIEDVPGVSNEVAKAVYNTLQAWQSEKGEQHGEKTSREAKESQEDTE